MNKSFGKEYKLCSKKTIDSLHRNGEIVKKYPFLLRYIAIDLPSEKSFQIVISVPKRNFKKAVDRNRLKRLIREAVRKNKHLLEQELESKNKKFALFLIYTGKEMETYQHIYHKIEILFQRLVENGL